MVDYAELRKELYEKFHDAYHKLYVSELQDEIDRLRAENEAILAANRDVMLHWDVLKADYERLRAALKPFAKEATHWTTYSDDEPVVEHFPGYEGEMVVGDLRRAFNVLEENANEKV